jgi:uncharacterized protein YjbI with pentapeptide repeats
VNGDRRPAGEPVFSLPSLSPFEGTALEPRQDHDSVDFVELVLDHQLATDSRFLECRLARCSVDGLSLRRARIRGTLLEDLHGATLDLADSTWQASRVTGGRLGAVRLSGATLGGVIVHGTKIGYLDLSAAQLEDVAFEGCQIETLDLRAARVERVTLVGCTVEELNVTEARLTRLDLSGAGLRNLVGIDNLRGTIVSHEQVIDLAPCLAGQLGIEVRPADPQGDRS